MIYKFRFIFTYNELKILIEKAHVTSKGDTA